ncbi:quinol monooxygenase YgiN [Deinococcus metalli]|uniref:Quinol monooxygenase YgiN n=1 Tax=Deinococcus metalli TaxID=1141878 RepID=A0A7W8KK69_9DEIO|nr:putative quinol monooxygenase [Deinococcus metalli]MBB5378044.1 quinol monooxygenase YgiN [Deinococcus metalli]GHF53991.1 hypothetical protein GCM10017781_32850 [Deinococcus metalli]
MSPINLLATLTPAPGQAAALRAGLLAITSPSRQEHGCERYEVLESGEDDTLRFHVIERFTDAAALQAHGDSDHFRAFSAHFSEWLAGPPEVIRARELSA